MYQDAVWLNWSLGDSIWFVKTQLPENTEIINLNKKQIDSLEQSLFSRM